MTTEQNKPIIIYVDGVVIKNNAEGEPTIFGNLDAAILFVFEGATLKDPVLGEQPLQIGIEYAFVSNEEPLKDYSFRFEYAKSEVEEPSTSAQQFDSSKLKTMEDIISYLIHGDDKPANIFEAEFPPSQEELKTMEDITSYLIHGDDKPANIFESEFAPSKEELEADIEKDLLNEPVAVIESMSKLETHLSDYAVQVGDERFDKAEGLVTGTGSESQSVPENDIMVASAWLEGGLQDQDALKDAPADHQYLSRSEPGLNYAVPVDPDFPEGPWKAAHPMDAFLIPEYKYRVFENGHRLASIYVDWGIDTFHTHEDASAFVYRWVNPGNPADISSILPLGEDTIFTTTSNANEVTHKVIRIEQVDLSKEPADQRHIGLDQKQNASGQPEGDVVITTRPDGRCVLVSRQDSEHRILSVIWEAPPQVAVPESWNKIVHQAVTTKKKFFPINLNAKDILAVNSLLPGQFDNDKITRFIDQLIKAQHDAVYKYRQGLESETLGDIIEHLKTLHQIP